MTSRGKKGIGSELFSVTAKGGKGGRKKAEISLIEYWLMEDSGGWLIHVVGEGSVDEVDAVVHHDYFFNGLADDDFSFHYEYFHNGPPPEAVTALDGGRFHVDIPWSGEKNDAVDFRDQLVTNVGGDGSDPFVFDLRFLRGGNWVGGVQPQGVVEAGQVLGPKADIGNALHGGTSAVVTSYATFKGDPAAGVVSVAELSLSGASCEIQRRRTGRGKNATWDEVSVVRADVHALVQTGSGAAAGPVWLEFHLVDAVSGDTEVGESAMSDPISADFTMTGEFSGARTSINLQLQLDYLYPVMGAEDFVYDPAGNSDIGFTTTDTWPATVPGGEWWPVAVTEPAVEIICQYTPGTE
jgi:hypothetical protein